VIVEVAAVVMAAAVAAVVVSAVVDGPVDLLTDEPINCSTRNNY